jgi:hypothetical protein
VVAPGADSPAFAITPDSHARIVDVKVDGLSVGATTSVTLTNVQNDRAVWAIFGPELVPVTIVAGANGSISAGGIPAPLVPGLAFAGPRMGVASSGVTHMVPYGTSATFRILPRLGYHIQDVIVDGVSVGAVYSYTMPDVTAPQTISAVFALDTFTITPIVTGRGTVTPSTPQTVGYGGHMTFTMTTASPTSSSTACRSARCTPCRSPTSPPTTR